MKRKCIIEITECYQCPKFTTEDGFSTHKHHCPDNGETEEISSPESIVAASKQLEQWFETCKRWPEIGTPLNPKRSYIVQQIIDHLQNELDCIVEEKKMEYRYSTQQFIMLAHQEKLLKRIIKDISEMYH